MQVKKGFAKTLIEHIANGTKGTFRGLGTLNGSLLAKTRLNTTTKRCDR